MMNKILVFIVTLSFTLISCNTTKKKQEVAQEHSALVLKNAFNNKFLIGTALNSQQIKGQKEKEVKIAKKPFNSIVAENVLKSGRIRPSEGEFDFSLPDLFVEFGEKNNMHIHGHTLIWHSQTPDFFSKILKGIY